jgi:hypothetical protein
MSLDSYIFLFSVFSECLLRAIFAKFLDLSSKIYIFYIFGMSSKSYIFYGQPRGASGVEWVHSPHSRETIR